MTPSVTPSPSASPSPSPSPPVCPACWPGTSGDCQASNGVCYPMVWSGVCPPGTSYCHTFGPEPVPTSPLCDSCTSGSGYCQSLYDGKCGDPFYGSVCWGGYSLCGQGASAPVTISRSTPWSGSNPSGVAVEGFTVSVTSSTCTDVSIMASDLCASTQTPFKYACLDLTVQVQPCSSSSRRLSSSSRRLRAGDTDSSIEDGAAGTTEEPLSRVEIVVPPSVGSGLPEGLYLALLVMGPFGGEMHQCARSYYDTDTSTVVGEDCPTGVYFVGMANEDTLDRMSSAVSSPTPTPTVSGTPAATPLPSSSPAPSTSAGVSMGSDGSDRTVDGTDNGSGDSISNTVVIGLAGGVGAVALVVGIVVVRSKKKKPAMKKGTIAPGLAPATRLKAGRPSVDRTAAGRHPRPANRHSGIKLKEAGATAVDVGRSLRGEPVGMSSNDAVMAAMMAEVAGDDGQQQLRGPEQA